MTDMVPKHFVQALLEPAIQEAGKFRGGDPRKMRRLLAIAGAKVEAYKEPALPKRLFLSFLGKEE